MNDHPIHYSLVPMTAEIIPDIAEIERVCFSHPWSENALHEELFNDAACFIAAVSDSGETLGYAGLHCILDEGYIANVAVKPEYRRQGVAAELIKAFIRFGHAKLSFITLEVRASNTPAISLYQKHGFLEVGCRKNYYSDPREDAILMTLEFSNGIKTSE